jgi:thiamine-monophosphate kinase
MSLSEFDIIAKYFQQQYTQRDDVLLGVGDDCAVLKPATDEALVVTMDTLVAGVHFPRETAAFDIGHKVLAVNLSDLASAGAEPQWITLSLTLPEVDEAWLKGFCDGLFELAQQFNVQLVGGDMTRGPLTITLQAHGCVPPQQALRRDGARPGDGVYVSGVLGEAATGLRILQQSDSVAHLDAATKSHCVQRLNRPQPRIALGMALRDVASAAIDISDGLAADLQHILDASHCGAQIKAENLPVNTLVLQGCPEQQVYEWALTGGDDFELCFTVSPDRQHLLGNISQRTQCAITRVGVVGAESGLHCLYQGEKVALDALGYRHF